MVTHVGVVGGILAVVGCSFARRVFACVARVALFTSSGGKGVVLEWRCEGKRRGGYGFRWPCVSSFAWIAVWVSLHCVVWVAVVVSVCVALELIAFAVWGIATEIGLYAGCIFACVAEVGLYAGCIVACVAE